MRNRASNRTITLPLPSSANANKRYNSQNLENFETTLPKIYWSSGLGLPISTGLTQRFAVVHGGAYSLSYCKICSYFQIQYQFQSSLRRRSTNGHFLLPFPWNIRRIEGVKMIGSFLTRGLVMIFGYAYPAYECYKSVELNKPDIEQLRFWCQYWVLVAGLTVFERIGDTFIGWVPMYGEAKLAFFLYLWYPKTKGTTYVYDSFFRPYIAKHETEIDRSLLELKTRAGDMALIYWQKTASYAQTRVFDILQFVAIQSTPQRPAQPPQKETKVQKPSTPSASRADATSQPQDEEQSSPDSSTSSSEHEEDAAEVAEPSVDSKADPAPAVLKEQKTTPKQVIVESSKTLSSSIEKVMLIDSVPPSVNESAPPVQETAAEEAGRLTRARTRKTRIASNR